MFLATSSSAPMRSRSAVTAVRFAMYALMSCSMRLMASARFSISSPVWMDRCEMALSALSCFSVTNWFAAPASRLMGLTTLWLAAAAASAASAAVASSTVSASRVRNRCRSAMTSFMETST